MRSSTAGSCPHRAASDKGPQLFLRAVNISSWREELFSRGVLDRDAASPREGLKRVKNSLHARRLIGIRDDLVWRA